MANCYIILLDTTKDRTDSAQMGFFKVPYLNDVAGFILHFAARNGSPEDAIRLYVAPDKKTWDKMSIDFSNRVVYPKI